MEQGDDADDSRGKEPDKGNRVIIAVGVLILLAGINSAAGNDGAAAAFFGASVATLFVGFWLGTKPTK